MSQAIRIVTSSIKRLKRVQKGLRKCKGRIAARIQETIMTAQTDLMNIIDNPGQLRLNFRYR